MVLSEIDDYILSIYENGVGANGDSLSTDDGVTVTHTILPDGEIMSLGTVTDCVIGQGELADKATEYLQSLAPSGFVFEWDMGELCLIHSEDCTGCEHDCPWKRTVPPPLGAPYCQICDDHSEALASESQSF